MKIVFKKTAISQRIEISSPLIDDIAFSPLAVVVSYRGEIGYKPPVIISPYCGHMTRQQAIEHAKAMSIAALLHELAESAGSVEKGWELRQKGMAHEQAI